MADVDSVQVSECLADLFEEEASLFLGDCALGSLAFQVLVKAHAVDELLDQVYLLCCLEAVDEPDDARVLQFLHAGDLALHCLLLRLVVQLVLRIDLYRHLLLCLLFLTEFHCSISSSSKMPNKLVVIDLISINVFGTSDLFFELHVESLR